MEPEKSNMKIIPSDADYKKAETDLLKAALKRSHTERFEMMTTLMNIGTMLKSAKIKHKQPPRKD